MKRTEWKNLKAQYTPPAGETTQQLAERQNNITSGPRFIYQFVGANNSNMLPGTKRFKPMEKNTRLVSLFFNSRKTRCTTLNISLI